MAASEQDVLQSSPQEGQQDIDYSKNIGIVWTSPFDVGGEFYEGPHQVNQSSLQGSVPRLDSDLSDGMEFMREFSNYTGIDGLTAPEYIIEDDHVAFPGQPFFGRDANLNENAVFPGPSFFGHDANPNENAVFLGLPFFGHDANLNGNVDLTGQYFGQHINANDNVESGPSEPEVEQYISEESDEEPDIWGIPPMEPDPLPVTLGPEDPLFEDAPSCNVPFPTANGQEINVTAAELLAFFPRHIRSTDVINRLISNGGNASLMARIIDAHRDTHRPITVGHFQETIKIRMRHMGNRTASGGFDYTEWTPNNHQIEANHDHNRLNIAGIRTMFQLEQTRNMKRVDLHRGPIPVKDLGKRIKQFPSGNDALCLTACVQYAMKHPDEHWIFPNDINNLIQHVFDNKVPVATQDHVDSAAFGRWKDVAPTTKWYLRSKAST